jgi:16S rRNA (guanine527-N7)-methyltransferase
MDPYHFERLPVTQCYARKPIRPFSSIQPSAEEEEGEGAEDQGNDYNENTITAAAFSLDPKSAKAKQIILNTLGLSLQQYYQILMLSQLIVQWNESVNLISRKDCTKDVVFGRHILPSLALVNLPNSPLNPTNDDDDDTAIGGKKIIDVGTGGGFPGLPLAIAYPQHRFLLVDSTGKKLQVVKAIADEIGLQNVQTHHGRVEEIIHSYPIIEHDTTAKFITHSRRYHVCLGRSVAPLPKFCSWIQELLRKDDVMLIYIIGGEIEDLVSERVMADIPLQELLPITDSTDNVGKQVLSWSEKRALVFPESSVARIGEPLQRRKIKPTTKPQISPTSSSIDNNRKPKPRPSETAFNNDSNNDRKRLVKGQWKKKDPSIPKQRGYENFKRFDTNDSNGS